MNNISIIVGIVCTIGTFLFSYVIPTIVKATKNYKKKQEQTNKRNATIDSIPERFDKLEKQQMELEDNLRSEIQEVKERQDDSEKRFDVYETQDLKYKIIDAFYSAENIQKIPYETLLIASECCDIYRGKGLNHEVGVKCDIIYEEIERRQRLKAEGNNGKKN